MFSKSWSDSAAKAAIDSIEGQLKKEFKEVNGLINKEALIKVLSNVLKKILLNYFKFAQLKKEDQLLIQKGILEDCYKIALKGKIHIHSRSEYIPELRCSHHIKEASLPPIFSNEAELCSALKNSQTLIEAAEAGFLNPVGPINAGNEGNKHIANFQL